MAFPPTKNTAIHSTAPDANILFFPFDKEKTETGPAIPSASSTIVEAGGDILELQTSKPKGGVGVFSVLLAPGKNYKGLLHPGAWCMIFISNSKLNPVLQGQESDGFKMLGIVRSVRRKESINPATGARQIRYLVSGEDFQSVFNSPIYINPIISKSFTGSATPFVLFGNEFAMLLTPDKIIKTLIEKLLGKPSFAATKAGAVAPQAPDPALPQRIDLPRKVPQGVMAKVLGTPRDSKGLFTGMLATMLQSNLIGQNNAKPEISGVTPSWQILSSYLNPQLNELYTDLLPVNVGAGTRLVPTIVLRSIPFSSKAVPHKDVAIVFTSAMSHKKGGIAGFVAGSAEAKPRSNPTTLPPNVLAHFYISETIQESEIIGLDTGKSDRERKNFFLVTSNLVFNASDENKVLASLVSAGIKDLRDSSSVERYGLSPYISGSDYITSDAGSIQNKMNQIVRDIWKDAHLFENGQVTIIGSSNHIPVGTNIEFERKDGGQSWIAHVEKVDHSYVVVPEVGVKNFRTTIAFVRLQTKSGEPIDAVEKNRGNERRDYDPGTTVSRSP
jgi:hypothetical protein